MYACLAVTCHLHFWQNDRDFLRATVVTRGWNGYRNKSQHRKSTLEKKILPPFQQGFEPATFQSRVRCSNHWAIPAPKHSDDTKLNIYNPKPAPQHHSSPSPTNTLPSLSLPTIPFRDQEQREAGGGARRSWTDYRAVDLFNRWLYGLCLCDFVPPSKLPSTQAASQWRGSHHPDVLRHIWVK